MSDLEKPDLREGVPLASITAGGKLVSIWKAAFTKPQALSALFKLLGEGKLKFEITKYPLREAAKVHQLFEARKTFGKVVLVP